MGRDANTIVLVGKGHFDEGEADAAINPGENIAIAADGNFDPAANDNLGIHLACESALNGKTVDDAYADGDRVFFYTPIKGDKVNVLVTSGETVAIGAELQVAAGGKFTVAAAGAGQLVALEASGGALAADTLLTAQLK